MKTDKETITRLANTAKQLAIKLEARLKETDLDPADTLGGQYAGILHGIVWSAAQVLPPEDFNLFVKEAGMKMQDAQTAILAIEAYTYSI